MSAREALSQVSRVCGWCGIGAVQRRETPTFTLEEKRWGAGEYRTVLSAAYLCTAPDCGRLSILFFRIVTQGSYDSDPEVVGQIPRGTPRAMQGVPDLIERDRREAWSCFYGGDLRASLLMARAAVQRAVRHLDAVKGSLASEVDDLLAKQKITQDLRDFATEVRLAGNDAAHPEELGDVVESEVVDSLTFMDDFLRVTIALPELQKARRAKRAADA